MVYKVKLDAFEGPFDLLVYLIEHNRMNVYDIKVSEITTQYLEYIEDAKNHDISVAQEFMVLAAELIELKSLMLLPMETPEGEEEIEDPRKQLVAKILEYKQFKEMASFLQDQEELTAHLHTKPQEDLSKYVGETEEIIKGDMQSFAQAFMNFITKKQRIEEMHRTYERIERAKMSMQNKIVQIVGFFKNRSRMKFSEMIKDDDTPLNRVVTFTTLLELVKQNSVRAEQTRRFGDINVEKIDGEEISVEKVELYD